jgi:hypothetical protein
MKCDGSTADNAAITVLAVAGGTADATLLVFIPPALVLIDA